MARLCGRLRAELPDCEVVMLGGDPEQGPPGMYVTATKLVELRNPLPDGRQRPPLLVFIPNDVRAAAEDSFGIATFEQPPLGNIYGNLRAQLLQEVPAPLRGAVAESLRQLTAGDSPWPFADQLAVVRFLLTARINGYDPEAIGAALYELALVPDFEFLVQPDRAPARITRNRDCVTTLTWSARSERGRVLDLGLADPTFRAELSAFASEAGLEDPRSWTRRIAHDRSRWSLAFNRWVFDDDTDQPDSVCISDVRALLPTAPEDSDDPKLSQLAGQLILPLGKDGLRKFSVTFRTDPAPSKVAGLARYSVQVVSQEHGPVGLVKAKAAWPSAKQDATVSFTSLAKADWEDGWHFIRVTAQGEAGDLLPLTDTRGNPIPWASDGEDGVPRANESDLFYVLVDADVDVEPPQRARPREDSLIHARTRLQFAAVLGERDPAAIAVSSVQWAQRKPGVRGADQLPLEISFGREGTVEVPVSGPLRELEQKILRAPGGPLSWHVPVALGHSGPATGEADAWPEGEAADRFGAARGAYFAAISADAGLVTQAADLPGLRSLIFEYADAYRALIADLQQRAASPETAKQALADLRTALAVDTVRLAIRSHRNRRKEAALVSPTHPLRALWLAVWAELGQAWLGNASSAPREFILPAREALLRHIAPVGFPPVVPLANGRLLTAVDNLHPFWTLYAPTYEEDPRGLVGEVCDALGLPEPASIGVSIDGVYLASRVQRYLVQHPYVQTLAINAFNPGSAALLADMLVELQCQPAFAGIRYDIRLFAPDADEPGLGEALAALLSPGSATTRQEADAFATPGSSHLRPKLGLAILPVADFRAAPGVYPAHLSMLFDVFPAGEVHVAQTTPQEAASPLHGLVQDFRTQYHEDEATAAWTRQPRHGTARPIPGAEALTDLLAALPALLSSATATVATGETGIELRPAITLALDTEDRSLLYQVHEVSDWVLTVDRNMGIEYFDHGGLADRPDYLIDHTPSPVGTLDRSLTITSRSVAELEAILMPVLAEYQLAAGRQHAVTVLDQLRSLSGRLALKLISAASQRAEALGLALSRMYLEHQGAFTNQIVVPLDAHLDLYRALQQNASELGDEVSFRRTDLALFDLDAATRTITCRLIEVKCYAQVGDIGSYTALRNDIAEQIAQSEQAISYHYDPHRSPVDRPDRLFKTRELCVLLEFYLDRAVRYQTITHEAEQEARFFLRTLEEGYQLNFSRSALIFDFGRPGTEPSDIDAGIEYHRIGVDLIQQLVSAATDPGSRAADADEGDAAAKPDGNARLVRLRELAPTVPTLDEAAFLGRPRDRTVSWESLAARRILGEDNEPVDLTEPPVASAEGVAGESPAADTGQPDQLAEQESSAAESPAQGQPGASSTGNAPAGDREGQPGEQPATRPENLSAQLAATATDGPGYDVLVGVSGDSPQYGILGEIANRKVGIDLNQTHTISLFGVQGGGKSYTLGTITEMASLSIPNINRLPRPLATVIFHYSQTMDYRPEFTSMVEPNTDAGQVAALRDRYGAEPQALTDVLLLVPADKLAERRAEYPDIEVRPLKFAASELQASHWRFLMGAVGNQATYMRQVNRIMRQLRSNLTLDGLRQGIDDAQLPDHLKDLARGRLDLAAMYIDDSARLSALIRPGRLIIVDLRDEFIEKDEALGLFVVLLQLFADATDQGQAFNKLVVFDEAHKYIESPDLVAGLIEVVREMRHKGTSIMVASQDPPSVPVSLIELSSQVILHKFNSPAWLRHIQKANAALSGLTAERMAQLKPGEAYIWSTRATDDSFTSGAVKIRCRPRVTQHGGATKTAL
jgi:hypothetical protein